MLGTSPPWAARYRGLAKGKGAEAHGCHSEAIKYERGGIIRQRLTSPNGAPTHALMRRGGASVVSEGTAPARLAWRVRTS